MREISAYNREDGTEGEQNGRTTMTARALSQETLNDIVRRVVEVAEPERVILFGSTARGDAHRNSDVDLLVVKDGADFRQLTARIYRRLYGVGPAVDIVMVTPQDVERYRDSHALVIKPALREGKVMYESP